MKKIAVYVYVMALLLCAGCQSKEDQSLNNAPFLELSTDHLSFINDYTGEQSVTVNANIPWSVIADKSWCKLSSVYGEPGRTRLRVAPDKYNGLESRTANLTFTMDGVSPKVLKITQLGEAEEIVLFAPSVTVSGDMVFLQVALTTNVGKLNVTVPEAVRWISLESSSQGAGASEVEKLLAFTLTKNNTGATREARITFSGGNAQPVVLTVSQTPMMQKVLNIVEANVDPEVAMRANGMKITFRVENTIDYSIRYEGDFLQEASASNDEYVVDLLANPGSEERTGRIIVSQDEEDGLVDTLIVRQLPAGAEFEGSRYLDSMALMSLYKAMDMKNWEPVKGVNWAFTPEQSMENWRAIKLNAQGRVVAWSMKGMQKSDSTFRFSIPAAIGDLPKVSKIVIHSWNLANIPVELGNLSLLDTLQLVGNLTGTLPVRLADAKALRYLSISGNVQRDPDASTTVERRCNLAGTIPSAFYDLNELRVLRINYSKIEGTLSDDISKLSNLEALYVENNQLTGQLPLGLAQLSKLEGFVARNNHLSGAIPYVYGNLSELSVLVLDNNQLSGSIPGLLCNLQKLEVLYLYANELSGSIPEEIGNMTALVEFVAHENSLSGSIPESITLLHNLQSLVIYANALSGRIPADIGNMTSLSVFVAHYNGLTGAIPASIDQLSKLRTFIVAVNKLSGTVPAGLVSKCMADPQNFLICPQDGTYFDNYSCNN